MSELDRAMLVQTVTLTIAVDPAKCAIPAEWKWHDLLDVSRDCQLLKIDVQRERAPSVLQAAEIKAWDNVPQPL